MLYVNQYNNTCFSTRYEYERLNDEQICVRADFVDSQARNFEMNTLTKKENFALDLALCLIVDCKS